MEGCHGDDFALKVVQGTACEVALGAEFHCHCCEERGCGLHEEREIVP